MKPSLTIDIIITCLSEVEAGSYSLIAMKSNPQYGVVRIFNVSHGLFIMFSAFFNLVILSKFSVDPSWSAVFFFHH